MPISAFLASTGRMGSFVQPVVCMCIRLLACSGRGGVLGWVSSVVCARNGRKGGIWMSSLRTRSSDGRALHDLAACSITQQSRCLLEVLLVAVLSPRHLPAWLPYRKVCRPGAHDVKVTRQQAYLGSCECKTYSSHLIRTLSCAYQPR
jgi:hypothetical protein